MEIRIEKKGKTIYFTIDGDNEKIMNFDNLVELAEVVIQKKDDEGFDYKVTISDHSLELYKSTVEELIKSILEDTDLLKLLSEKNQNV